MGTLMRVLSASYPMNTNLRGFRWLLKFYGGAKQYWCHRSESIQYFFPFNIGFGIIQAPILSHSYQYHNAAVLAVNLILLNNMDITALNWYNTYSHSISNLVWYRVDEYQYYSLDISIIMLLCWQGERLRSICLLLLVAAIVITHSYCSTLLCYYYPWSYHGLQVLADRAGEITLNQTLPLLSSLLLGV